AARGRGVAAGFGHDEAVDNNIDVVPLILVEPYVFIEVADLAVDSSANEASAPGLFEDAGVLAFLRASNRRQDHQARAGRVGERRIDDLLDGLLFDGAAALRAMRAPGTRPEKAHVVIDLGD